MFVSPGRIEARSIFDMYDHLKRIGSGSFGEVYSGKRKSPDRNMVAIKTINIRGDTLQQRQSNLKKAEREIELSRQIQCDAASTQQKLNQHAPYCAIIPIYDYWTDEMKRELIIEMKLITGMDGFDFAIRDNVVPEPYTHEYYKLLQYSLMSIANSLNHIHAKCVLHRDIKLENLLYNQAEQRFYLTDFGLSCSILKADECNNISGTRGYWDPLVMNSQIPYPNELSDTYALGQTFYILTTRKPYLQLTDKQKNPTLEAFKELYKERMIELHQLRDGMNGKSFQVMFDIIEQMLNPIEASKRPTLSSIVQALQHNDISLLQTSDNSNERTCTIKNSQINGGYDKIQQIKKNSTTTSFWIVDQDQY
jgi:serine/threonine protein kinase